MRVEGWRGGRGKLRGSCIRGARRTIDPNPNPNPDLDPTVILTLTLTLAQPLALALSLPPALILTVTPPLTLTRAKGRRPHLPGLAFWRPRHLSPCSTRRCLEDTCFQQDDAKNNATVKLRRVPCYLHGGGNCITRCARDTLKRTNSLLAQPPAGV